MRIWAFVWLCNLPFWWPSFFSSLVKSNQCSEFVKKIWPLTSLKVQSQSYCLHVIHWCESPISHLYKDVSMVYHWLFKISLAWFFFYDRYRLLKKIKREESVWWRVVKEGVISTSSCYSGSLISWCLAVIGIGNDKVAIPTNLTVLICFLHKFFFLECIKGRKRRKRQFKKVRNKKGPVNSFKPDTMKGFFFRSLWMRLGFA